MPPRSMVARPPSIDDGSVSLMTKSLSGSRGSTRICEKEYMALPPTETSSACVLVHVDPKSSLGQQEFFGPILAVLRANDLDEALRIANDVPYALTGGLYSRSPAHIARARREFRVGNLYVNRKITGALVDRQPFGGFRLSGIGSKAGGPDYLLQFVLPRTITENTLRRGFAPDPTASGI